MKQPNSQHLLSLFSRLLALLVVATPVQVFAQSMFKCQSASGTYYSDRPCPSDAKTSETKTALPNPLPPPLELDSRSAFLAYLSPECRQLKDTIRAIQLTRPSVRSERELYRQRVLDAAERYRGRCLEEERFALQKVSDAERQQRAQQREALAAKQTAKERVATEKAQCGEMRSIRDEKRQRLGSMTPGERSDFERFQSAFSTRCDGVVLR